MASESKVYRILIASPSDIGEERNIVSQVINEWNDLHSRSTNIVLLPVKWETHTAPFLGDRPQEIINNQIVKECDILVGLFWTRIGSNTGVSESGTKEEIEYFIKCKKPAMIYFSTQPIEPLKIDMTQFERLKRFKEDLKKKGLIEHYSNFSDLKAKFARHLTINIQKIENDVNLISKSKTEEESSTKLNKSDTVYFEYYGRAILVKGNTLDIREDLKEAGGKWNKSLGAWVFPKVRELEIAELIKSLYE